MPALQGDRLHEHLQANRAAEFLAEEFLLNFADEGRVRAVAVGRAVHPLVHRAVYACIDG